MSLNKEIKPHIIELNKRLQNVSFIYKISLIKIPKLNCLKFLR